MAKRIINTPVANIGLKVLGLVVAIQVVVATTPGLV